ncbi:MAG: peptidase U32 [Desulfuromonas sp.]|nr:MAG: peptidase U32 [Desulfuromonas sp.]
MRLPELLAPAGNLEKLRCALDYGADAVYAGLQHYSLRAQADNLSWDDYLSALQLCRSRGKRLYLTLNAFFRQAELDDLATLVRRLANAPPDALIVSDPGAIATIRDEAPGLALHLSTQANTVNAASIDFWSAHGVSRVNLARELGLEEIAAIRKATGVELEVFVHGAMCVAWSGRCLLSAALTGRSANRGACTHPCRWKYALMEESRPGEYFPIEEDSRGSYLLNSRDLCLLEELPALVAAGVNSLKIEGRMKSPYYVASVTRVYREALDRLAATPQDWQVDSLWLKELDMVSHRPYGKGLQGEEPAGLYTGDSRYIRRSDFLGRLESVTQGRALLTVRNRFFAEESLEIIGPGMRTEQLQISGLASESGAPLEVAQPNQRVVFEVPSTIQAGDLLRRVSPLPDPSVAS